MVARTFLVALIILGPACSPALGADAPGETTAEGKPPLAVFEGILKVHPKFLYKYYITGFAGGQHFALFGDDKLKDIAPGSIIHVEGRLGTRLHPGGDEKNPSPFSRAWYVYMEVESVKVLKLPDERSLFRDQP